MKKLMYLLSSLIAVLLIVEIFYTQGVHEVMASSEKKSNNNNDIIYCLNGHENCNLQECSIAKPVDQTNKNNTTETTFYCPNNHENCTSKNCLQTNDRVHHANKNCPNGHKNCNQDSCYNKNSHKNNHYSKRHGH